MVLRTSEQAASPPYLTLIAPAPASPRRFSDGTILLAVRHHQRALDALREGSFDGLSIPTSDRLIGRLSRDLERLEAELDRRKRVRSAEPPRAAVPLAASPGLPSASAADTS